MTSVTLLVVMLVILAGVIAYAGDRLGTWVGRRRLTVFGARPKVTGQIVGVGAGIVIMLTTLTVLAFAFTNATQTLVNAQRTADELAGLRAQERVLQTQLGDVRSDLEALQVELTEAQAVIDQAQTERAMALAERDAARAERNQAQADRDALVADIDATQAQLALLAADLDAASADRHLIEAELEQAQQDRETALADRASALEDATEARAEAERLEAEVEQTALALDVANVRLLELQVLLAEADANVEAAVARLTQAEAATRDAEAARDLASSERDAAEAARTEALAEAEILRETADALTLELDELAREVAALEATGARLAQEATVLQQENVGLQARNDQLVSANADLVQRNDVLAQLNTGLQGEIVAGNEMVGVLESQVAGLTDRLEEESRRLSEVQQEFSRVASGEITFERDQLIYSGAIYANEPAAVREELAEFVRSANAATTRQGAGEVVLSAAQFNSLVEVISETEGSDLVRLISPRNQFSPTQVEVVVEALENTRVFDRGRLLASRHVHLGSVELPATQDEIRTAISQLKAEALRVSRRAGLDELQVPAYVGASDEGFSNQLLRLQGPVVIGVATVEAVDRAGPGLVELIIVY
jgi:uncharacterized protein (DUF3084 family)